MRRWGHWGPGTPGAAQDGRVDGASRRKRAAAPSFPVHLLRRTQRVPSPQCSPYAALTAVTIWSSSVPDRQVRPRRVLCPQLHRDPALPGGGARVCPPQAAWGGARGRSRGLAAAVGRRAPGDDRLPGLLHRRVGPTSASHSALIASAGPPILGALALWLWRGERPVRWTAVGLGIGFAGVASSSATRTPRGRPSWAI